MALGNLLWAPLSSSAALGQWCLPNGVSLGLNVRRLPSACSRCGSARGCCSVAQSCPTLCDPMDCSTPGFPVLYCLPEPAQTRVHWFSDAIHPVHPLLSPSPPALNLSQCQLHWHLSRALPSASSETEPLAAIAVDLQQPLRELRVSEALWAPGNLVGRVFR